MQSQRMHATPVGVELALHRDLYIVWCSVNCATKTIAIGTEAGSNVEHHMNLNKGLP